ncbi:MAG: integrase arm-type DNA-binding domain-containing protein [Gammaproteobacteria bacterium]|nr:integrase arm-type DNA-binding domain-containing protein [Gammaproteobacteria bacterium]MDE0414954.1 integrase arm-type DNA-binding domain-containing protein [Gammaproteobacteria bacterium]
MKYFVGQGKLTVKKVRAINQPGLYGDGNTLYLRVAPGGSKQWVQRLTIHGKRRDIGLGGCSWVTLAEARDAAYANRRMARRGGDPLAVKRQPKVPTFREAAQRTFEALRPRWRSEKVAVNWMQKLERHAMARLGAIPVDQIGREHVLAVLTPIWTTKPETGRKVRQNIRATLKWCQAHGFVQFNAAGEAIDGALPRMPAVKAHFRALPYAEIPEALSIVQTSGASRVAKLALKFLIFTAARSGEVRGATWTEIHSDVWKIPGERMKAGVEHRVPLSAPALEVLEHARALNDGSALIFPSPVRRGRDLSDMTLTKVLRDTGLAERATVHGFRSSFRDWCAETGKAREVAEAALAHTVGGVEGAYFRSDLFERRRCLMDAWAAFLTAAEGK